MTEAQVQRSVTPGLPCVDAAVVTWNSASTLRACLESLRDSVGVEVLVHVVDNDSGDATKEILAGWTDPIDVVYSEANLGFPIATNLGAARGTADYVLLVNPDVIVTEEAIIRCVRALEASADRSMVGPRVLLPSGEVQLECARNLPGLWNTFCKSMRLDRLFRGSRLFDGELMPHWDHLSGRNVPCISGAFMLLGRKTWEAFRGLDEAVFMYYEDIDLCARVNENGGKIWYEPSAVITHFGRVSSSQSDRDLDRLGWETRVRFFREHGGAGTEGAARLILALQALVGLAVSPVVAAAGGAAGFRGRLALRWRRNSGLLRWALGREVS